MWPDWGSNLRHQKLCKEGKMSENGTLGFIRERREIGTERTKICFFINEIGEDNNSYSCMVRVP
jgi:hypothetical protein